VSLSYSRIELAPTKSAGTGRKYAMGFARVPLIAVEFVIEAVGSTPTVTFTIQGLQAGGEPGTATDWSDTGYVTPDSTVAASKAAIVKTAIGRYVYYVDGLDKRFYDGIAVNISANTNVTYRVNAYAGR
jgi:hypothetical protein